ncbi:MAG: hypothetical protein KF730_14775 [Sphingomonas sp.]|uniref:hypothetical protein n=1 Tax=Sphingomonas sp. TaxID=28214 RepID=UPI0025E64189|nr:hypothetical protein [Sphingomonas sp.]MBX3565831.1 hypothetical protein [Sphingomonas sp.]
MNESKPKRWLLWLSGLGVLAVFVFRIGFDIAAWLSVAWLLGAMAICMYVATRVKRPRRSYLIAALGSGGVAILLLGIGSSFVAVAFWLVLSALGLCWAWYWERTEPLPEISSI